jgi:hypothetical protein
MSNQFTKVYKEEDELLRGCSYNVASVYFHLKNKREYFKSQNNGTCYDLTRCISEYTGMCEKTIKRAISTLREIGLISTVIKGKVNHYSFPILDKIEGKTDNKVVETIQPIEEIVKEETTPVPTPVEEVEYDDYSEELYQLLESDDMRVVKNILERTIDYAVFNKNEYEFFFKNGDNKINEITQKYQLSQKDIDDLQGWVKEFQTTYIERLYAVA